MSPADHALALAAAPAAGPQPIPAPVPAPARRRSPAVLNDLLSDLHARHGKELLGFCRWMLKDAEEAADAMQDTWIRAMTALGDEGVRVAALRPWLYAIARNVCLDRLRERKRQSLQDLDVDDGGTSPAADHVVEIRQEAAAALALVASLSDRQRQALLMREVAGLDVPDIAKALGVTPERAAWTITDARRALDDVRSGSAIDCADVRARLGAGRRGRSLQAHLQGCGECRAHEAKRRVRRVLAPAVLPFLWLRRLSRPLFLKPATAAVVAGVTAASVPLALHQPHPGHRAPAAPAVRDAVSSPAPQRAVAHRATAAAAPHRRHRQLPATPPAARHAAPAAAPAPVAPATVASSERAPARPVGPARPAAPAVVRHVVTAAAGHVHRTLHGVEHAVSRVPAAGQVVAPVVDAADGVVARVVG